MKTIVHRTARALMFLLAVLGLTASGWAQQAADKPADPAAILKQIEEDTQEVRGLKFTRPVTYQSMDKAQIMKNFHEEAQSEELRARARAYEVLGLLPAGYDLEKELLELLAEQVGAFYDHDAKALFTFRDTPLGQNFQRVLLAHELTHALQDQNFGCFSFPEMKLKDNDDRQRAFQALFEGDATAVMPKVMMKRLELDSIFGELMQAMNQKTERLEAAPPFLRNQLTFPYTAGQQFVDVLQMQSGSADAINRAYKDLPRSTEQILHPEKYYDRKQRDDPREVTLAPLNSPHWKLVDNNVLGEFGIRELFTTQLVPPDPLAPQTQTVLGKMMSLMSGGSVPPEIAAAAEGWGGDRFNLYERNNGNGRATAALWWISVWDSHTDAAEFANTLRKAAQKRFPDAALKEVATASTVVVLENKTWRIRVTRAGDRVTVVQAPPEQFEEFSALVERAAK